MRSEGTAKSIPAAGVSEVSEAARFIAAGVLDVTLLLLKGVLLLSEWGFEEVFEIPIGEKGEQFQIEKDGKSIFFAESGREHFEKYPLRQHTFGWHS